MPGVFGGGSGEGGSYGRGLDWRAPFRSLFDHQCPAAKVGFAAIKHLVNAEFNWRSLRAHLMREAAGALAECDSFEANAATAAAVEPPPAKGGPSKGGRPYKYQAIDEAIDENSGKTNAEIATILNQRFKNREAYDGTTWEEFTAASVASRKAEIKAKTKKAKRREKSH